MGQSKPVRVILLVTRNSIEERVLKIVEMKRSLFSGVFDGESDEVNFYALGQPQFLQSVRELIGETAPEPIEESASGGRVSPIETTVDARMKLLQAGVQFLEALADVLGQDGATLPPALALRAGAAVRRVFAATDGDRRDC
jgi:hypothetical protein